MKIIMKSDLTDDQIGSRLINNLPTLFTKPLFQDKKRWRPNFPNYVQSQSRAQFDVFAHPIFILQALEIFQIHIMKKKTLLGCWSF